MEKFTKQQFDVEFLTKRYAYYGEIGWWKKSDGSFKGLIVWENPIYNSKEFTYSSGVSHSFSNQWDPNTSKYHWFYDGNWIHF